MDFGVEAEKRGKNLRILVTRLRFLGDIIITTPVISSLKERYPEAMIYYLADARYADILEENPALDGIIRLEKNNRSFLRTLELLRSLDITAAIDLFYNPTSANLLFLSRIPIRIGGRRKWRRHLYTDTCQVPVGVRSAVSHHLHFIDGLECDVSERRPRVYLSAEEVDAGRKSLEKLFQGRRGELKIAAFHAGGTWQSKRWTTRGFAELAKVICAKGHYGVVLLTGPGEEEENRRIVLESGSDVKIIPYSSLRDTAALMKACDALVANDGGILHLAVALGLPTTGIFGPTEPDIWFPYEGMGPFSLATRNEDCAPCHLHHCDERKCLDLMKVETVLDKLVEVTEWTDLTC
ncbi:MAG: glycosyltransferase family 9 protein [Bacteroidales bacterium]|nr:glycosyltransferase family 9 protein [Candidatus Latescibacterota bacterium]